MTMLRIFLFHKAYYLKEIHFRPQKKSFSKGYGNGKVCYFLPFLFSSYSSASLIHPHRLKKSPCLLTGQLEVRDHQEGTKVSGSHGFACHQIVFLEHPAGETRWAEAGRSRVNGKAAETRGGGKLICWLRKQAHNCFSKFSTIFQKETVQIH